MRMRALLLRMMGFMTLLSVVLWEYNLLDVT